VLRVGRGLKVFIRGHFLFTSSDTLATATMNSATDRQTDNIMMPIADHTVYSTIG